MLDERLCDTTASFKCRNTRNCVLQSWLGDGEDDCGDGSDEGPNITPLHLPSFIPTAPSDPCFTGQKACSSEAQCQFDPSTGEATCLCSSPSTDCEEDRKIPL